jgi:hypothetical protein
MVSAVSMCRKNVRGPLQNLKKEVRRVVGHSNKLRALGSATGWVVLQGGWGWARMGSAGAQHTHVPCAAIGADPLTPPRPHLLKNRVDIYAHLRPAQHT